jgi:hypothetical protein
MILPPGQYPMLLVWKPMPSPTGLLMATKSPKVPLLLQTRLFQSLMPILPGGRQPQILQFLAPLLEKKIKARYTETPFELNGQTYQPGTLVITRTGNEMLGENLISWYRASQQTPYCLTPVSTGFVSKGSDFGSYSVRPIKAPRVAVLAGEGISSSAFGEVWHYFEQQIHYPITVIRTSYFNSVPLSNSMY